MSDPVSKSDDRDRESTLGDETHMKSKLVRLVVTLGTFASAFAAGAASFRVG